MSLAEIIRFRVSFWLGIIPRGQKYLYLGFVLLGVTILMVKLGAAQIIIGALAIIGLFLFVFGIILCVADFVKSFRK